MKASFNQKILAWIAAWAMVVAPVVPVYAQTAAPTPAGPFDYNALCSPAAQAATGISDQTSAYCTQAAMAQEGVKMQTAIEILMMAAGASMTILAFTPMGQSPACTIDSNVADAGALALDITEAIKVNNLSTAMTSGISTEGMSMAVTGVGAIAGAAVADGFIGKGMSTALRNHVGNTVNSKITNMQCIVDAGMAFAQGAIAMIQVSFQKKAIQTALQQVASLIAARPAGSSSFSLTSNTAPTTSGSSGTAANAVAGAATASSGACAGSSSNAAYLACLSKNSAVSAALTANPDAMNALDQALGQPAAAFVQGYNGDGSAASVAGAVGAAMGMSPTGTAALQKAIDTSADLASKGDYKPATYAASAAPVASGASGDVDFSKMMSGMMSKLAPDAGKGEDPSTIVYRQLDLLPPSKIEANKDISIFARIGYRYRKSSGNVEQLNWANPANQTTNNTPISASATTPTTAADSTRAPASKN